MREIIERGYVPGEEGDPSLEDVDDVGLEGEEGRSGGKRKEGETDRERRIRLGIERPSVMDIQYAKRGAIREWDVGKEVT